MKVEVLNSDNKKLVSNLKEKELLLKTLDFKEAYKGYNEVFDVLLGLENKEVKNFCIITGAQDNRLFDLKFMDLTKKKFVATALDYVFSTFCAETISIKATPNASSILLSLGFEHLGIEDNLNLYVKDRVLEQSIERSK